MNESNNRPPIAGIGDARQTSLSPVIQSDNKNVYPYPEGTACVNELN